jgi:hypothetical protein
MRCPLGANRLFHGIEADFGTVGGPAGGCRCREQECGRASSPTGCRFLAAGQNRLDIGAADATDFVPVVEASPMKLLRLWCPLAAFAVPLVLVAGVGRAANVNFNFNASPEGWTFGTIPPVSGTATPAWGWFGAPSSSDGGLEALLVGSGSGAGAWAMSPCLEILQNSQQPYIHVDFSHYTQFPPGILGQVQVQTFVSGSWGSWQGIPTAAWKVTNHVAPTEANVFPPLATSPGAPPNDWLAFSGTNTAGNHPTASTGSGPHVLSAFTLQWADYGLANGSEVRFRFLVGVDDEFAPQLTESVLWEVNEVTIDGARVCVIPEPGSLALAGGALVCGVVGLRGRRRRRGPAAPALASLAAATEANVG